MMTDSRYHEAHAQRRDRERSWRGRFVKSLAHGFDRSLFTLTKGNLLLASAMYRPQKGI